jgi:predicted ATPase
MMTRLAISSYRSLRDVRLTLGELNVVTGANGSGKSSLYRALKLLAEIAQGRIIQSVAAEGGLQSTLWAGPEALCWGAATRLPSVTARTCAFAPTAANGDRLSSTWRRSTA